MKQKKKNSMEFVDLVRQYRTIKPEIDRAMKKVILASDFILGEEVKKFESGFAAAQRIRHILGVSSGTSALLLAMMALGVKKGDKIITTPNTFIATVEPLIFLGAEPVFIDIKDDGNMDESLVEEKIDGRVKGIIGVHIYGNMLNVKKLRRIADKHRIFFVEDCAQAHLAEFDRCPAGATGDISVFSFYPGKNLGAYGDAGAVATNDGIFHEMIYKMRNHGRLTKYEHSSDGLGERMDGIQAAVLNVKLQHLDKWTARRIEIAKMYNDLLSGIEGLSLPAINERRHVFHLYVVNVPGNRDAVIQGLKEMGIPAGIHYPVPLHMQPVYKNRKYGKKKIDLPRAERFAETALSLPIFPEMTVGEVARVASSLKSILKKI